MSEQVQQPKRKRKPRSLTFRHLREKNVARCNDTFHPVNLWSNDEWLTAVLGELGEVAHLLKHLKRGESIAKGALNEELADVVIYLDLLAAKLGVELDIAIMRKFNTISERVGSSIKLHVE